MKSGNRPQETGDRNSKTGSAYGDFGFENLLVWKKSVDLSVDLFRYMKTCSEFAYKIILREQVFQSPAT